MRYREIVTENLDGVKPRYRTFDTHDWLEYHRRFSTAKEFADRVTDPSDPTAHDRLMKRWERMNSIPHTPTGAARTSSLHGLKKYIADAIGATDFELVKEVPWGNDMMDGPGCYVFTTPKGRVFLDAATIKTGRDEEVWMSQISTENKGNGLGTEVMNAIHDYAKEHDCAVKVFKITNKKFFDRFKWITT